MLSEKGPFALDTTSAYSRVEITLKMIGLKGEALSPCASNEMPEVSHVDHRNNLALEDFEGRCYSEITCDWRCQLSNTSSRPAHWDERDQGNL